MNDLHANLGGWGVVPAHLDAKEPFLIHRLDVILANGIGKPEDPLEGAIVDFHLVIVDIAGGVILQALATHGQQVVVGP